MSEMSTRQRITLAEFLGSHFLKVRADKLNAEALEEMTVGERYAARFGGLGVVLGISGKSSCLETCQKTNEQQNEEISHHASLGRWSMDSIVVFTSYDSIRCRMQKGGYQGDQGESGGKAKKCGAESGDP